jgi:uncharacterized SAM-binding protein YcdF (DUF218 family)
MVPQMYDVLKSFIDPVFIIFVLLLISFVMLSFFGKQKEGGIFLLFIIVLLYGFSIQPVSGYLSYQLEKSYIKSLHVDEKAKLDVVVVLSGTNYDIQLLDETFPGETTTVRLVHAVRLYKQSGAKYLVCSGRDQTRVSGAELMAQMAESLGVPGHKIRIEAKSLNTYEHAVELSKMFPDKDIRIGLVTSAWHMKRSETQFRKYFKNVQPLPAGFLYASPAGSAAVRFIPQSQCLLKNTLIFREYIGRFWYGLKSI